MPAKSKYSASEVVQYLHDHAGEKFAYRKLSRIFHCGSEDMRGTLAQLASAGTILVQGVGPYQYYFVAEREKVASEHPMRIAAKPYQQSGRAWDTVRERIADFRAGPSLYATLGTT